MQMTLSSFISNLDFAFYCYIIDIKAKFALTSRMECKLCEMDSMVAIFRAFYACFLVPLIRSWVCCQATSV